MRYLFFDIECANCFQGKGKICSFGYVLTDRNFIILEREDILVNPRSRFYLVGRGNGPDLELAYPQSAFRHAPAFPDAYPKIYQLLSAPDTIVFGHATHNDVSFVKSECERYHLKQPDYVFYDSQKIYQSMIDATNQISLEQIMMDLDLPLQHMHKSVDDAEMTMRVVQKLCVRHGMTLEELIEKYPYSKGEIQNGVIRHFCDPEKSNRMTHANRVRFQKFLDFLNCSNQIVKTKEPTVFSGKRFGINSLYEYEHFRQMVVLVTALGKCGASYTTSALHADYFITSSAHPNCVKERAACRASARKKHPQLLTVAQAMNLLSISEQEWNRQNVDDLLDFAEEVPVEMVVGS